jgi:hypothetical protein
MNAASVSRYSGSCVALLACLKVDKPVLLQFETVPTNLLVGFELRTAIVCREKLKGS